MINHPSKTATCVLSISARLFLVALLVFQQSSLAATYSAFQVDDSISGNTVATDDPNNVDEVITVRQGDLANDKVAQLLSPTSWFFYNDETDTIDNSIGSFVAGPAAPIYGEGSAKISVTGTQRRNLATYLFRDLELSDITELAFSTYNPSAGNGGVSSRSAYLHFNVDFDNSDTWQRRLVFVPSANDTVVQNTWKEWDAIDGGNALWCWSGMTGCGGAAVTWPTQTGVPFANPNAPQQKWSDILAAYPNISTRATDSWLGLRVGEPYSNGYTENIDSFTIGINQGWNVTTTTYDFEPDTVTSSSETVVVSTSDMQGWEFNSDRTTWTMGTGEMVVGPATPPMATGSARLTTPTANNRTKLRHYLPAGTLISDIVELKYSTYRAEPTGGALSAALQFDVDMDGTPVNPAKADGRIVYEPYYTQTTLDDVWQNWDALNDGAGTGTGNWWIAGPNGGVMCTIADPCTWTQLKANYPDLRISAKSLEDVDTQGAMMFKAGGSWAGFDGNVDKFVIGIKSGVNVHTTTYDFESTSDAPYVPVAGDIIINEVMWMGSNTGGSTADEWIELRNTTTHDIDLEDWMIENLGTAPDPIITIPSGVIPAGGYFLVGNYASNNANSAISNFITVDFATTDVQLQNSGEQLTLRDSSNTLIDQTPTGNWAAGNNTMGLAQSMERNAVPGSGTSVSDWHTCIDSGCTSTAFWDTTSDNYGTPRALNLSENDPTTADYVKQDWSHTVAWVADDNDLVDDSEKVVEAPSVVVETQETATDTPAIVEVGGGGDSGVTPAEEVVTNPEQPEELVEDEEVEQTVSGDEEVINEEEETPNTDEQIKDEVIDDGAGEEEPIPVEETVPAEPEPSPEPESEPVTE